MEASFVYVMIHVSLSLALLASTILYNNIMAISFSTVENTREVVQMYLTMSFAVAMVIWYIQFLWKRRYLYIHSWKVEGPFSFPIIGCGYLFLGNGTDIIRTLIDIMQNMSTELLRIWLGPKLLYFVFKPEHIEILLNHPKALNKEGVYRFVSDAVGFGLLTAPVKKWKKHRKLLAPAFHRQVLDSFVEVFAQKSIILVDELKSVVGQKNMNLGMLIISYTLDVVSETAMGVNMIIQEEKSTLRQSLEDIFEIINFRIFRIWLHPDLFWHFSPLRAVFEKNRRELKEFAGSVVSEKMAQQNERMKLKQHCVEAEIEEPTYKRLPFLDLILKDSKLTETELREEVEIFLAAGTDTSAATLCCLFTMLGMHTEVQQKVFEEVIDILGPDRIVEATDLPKMKYTEMVIKETLRLFPIAPIFARAIEEDIDIGDTTLPAGSSVAFCCIFIHRNPKYWKDPLKFDPNRFLPEEVARRHPCSYIPFSYGPRNCIGWKYAIANIKVAIATVIRQYRIFTEYKSVEEIQVEAKFVLRLPEGPKVWIEYR